MPPGVFKKRLSGCKRNTALLTSGFTMPPKKRCVRKTRKQKEPSDDEEEDDAAAKKALMKFRRKGKRFIGAHVSIAGGIWKAVDRSLDVGACSFGMFLGSHRNWKRPSLNEVAAEKFLDACEEHDFDPAYIVPHGPYIMNCGSPNKDVFEKSQRLLEDELGRCRALGLTLYNLHPGSSLGTITPQQCMDRIARAINHAHRQIPSVVTVLENMCGQGHTVGGDFAELRGIIDLVRDKNRVGVCLDTCHAFAAGYDLAAPKGVKSMLDEFHRVVGLPYLCAIHLNDSKGKLGCKVDNHEDIGHGMIGLTAFKDIVKEPRLKNIPMILETPGRDGFHYEEQINLLYSL